ncbi:uncharacterized protein K452DRAFT_286130 [Aplosporella prunicola CBS 121167]|uniref:Uncharacterized protein n=1 Tax=Aplosporella prunicola CBS 121167 TaxID=1176127 RepID=A0A6A6BL48_9PEZI|nr:uncharacterized protein K452DRAFT_286130 [Aplosporella prunicola CBS 121167]KAF2143301.1 hypothetical protein K452DRAFT_286130 [Aplosporella prunicola CBS 121167]
MSSLSETQTSTVMSLCVCRHYPIYSTQHDDLECQCIAGLPVLSYCLTETNIIVSVDGNSEYTPNWRNGMTCITFILALLSFVPFWVNFSIVLRFFCVPSTRGRDLFVKFASHPPLFTLPGRYV